MSRKRAIRLFFILIAFAALGILLAVNQVDNAITAEDELYIGKVITRAKIPALPAVRSYQQELAFIDRLQKIVFRLVDEGPGQPKNAPREPKNVYQARIGSCFDRSRLFEKLFRVNGFQTRHVAIYSTLEVGSKWLALLTPDIPSHAVTEVLTQQGWLVVDSNDRWLAVDKDLRPYSMDAVQADAGEAKISWHPKYHYAMNSIYKGPFTYVYGLYSRHGRYYPPYNFIPDVQYRELFYNVSSG